MIVIIWARVCIILHNLIICIEGDNFDEIWRDGLMQAGLDGEQHVVFDADEEGELRVGDTLEWAWRRVETPGQHFRLRLMDDLFNSPSLSVEHRS